MMSGTSTVSSLLWVAPGIKTGPHRRPVDGLVQRLSARVLKRTAQVEPRAEQLIAEAEVKLGRGLTAKGRARFYEVAVLETRTVKDHTGQDDRGLFDRWRTEAGAAGFDPDLWVALVIDRDRPETGLDREVVVAEVLAELQGSQSTWTRTDVVRRLARRVPVGLGDAEAARAWIETMTDKVLADRSIVALAAPGPPPPGDLRRRDGRSVFERHAATRYSTDATLALEQQVLDIATAGRGAGRGAANRVAVDAVIAHSGLGDDQAAVVRAVTQDGDTVACVVGPAGTGKSHTMGAAAHAWAATGIPVRGLAVSAAAAGVLQSGTGIASDTVAKFLHEHDRPAGPGPDWRLHRGEVLVVDEASMVPSTDLARVVILADQAAGKVVLVGDWAQLGAVDAGGLFRLLAHDHNVELSGVRRFTHDWERAASLELRDRAPTVLGVYEDHGRVVGGTRAVILGEAFARWQQARAAGESVVVCASDHATVADVAARCRAARVEAGEVEAGGVPAKGHVVGVGDEIVTTRNDRRLTTTGAAWVRNGDRWQVDARHPDGSITVTDLTGRGRLTLPGDYVTDNVTLAYAVTVHKAQGLTVDRAVLIADDTTTAEALYVAMTRGRHSNTALVVTDPDDLDHPATEERTAHEVLTGALRRVSGERSATEELRHAMVASESLAVLNPRLASIDAHIARECPPDRTTDLHRLAEHRSRLERHARPGRLTRAARDDRHQLLELDERQHELDAAQQHRHDWLNTHADTLAYRDHLAIQVTARRVALGAAATSAAPRHLVDLLGPVPRVETDRARWAKLAGRVEAYREEWGIEPERLREPPVDGTQYRHWQAAVKSIDLIRRLDAPHIDRGLDRGLGIGL
jgi:hypothetical protein